MLFSCSKNGTSKLLPWAALLGPIGDLLWFFPTFASLSLRWSLLKRAGVYSAEDGVTLDQLREVQAGGVVATRVRVKLGHLRCHQTWQIWNQPWNFLGKPEKNDCRGICQPPLIRGRKIQIFPELFPVHV